MNEFCTSVLAIKKLLRNFNNCFGAKAPKRWFFEIEFSKIGLKFCLYFTQNWAFFTQIVGFNVKPDYFEFTQKNEFTTHFWGLLLTKLGESIQHMRDGLRVGKLKQSQILFSFVRKFGVSTLFYYVCSQNCVKTYIMCKIKCEKGIQNSSLFFYNYDAIFFTRCLGSSSCSQFCVKIYNI